MKNTKIIKEQFSNKSTTEKNNSEAKLLELNLLFLSEASKVLSSSLDYETTLNTVAKIAVPHIADWCTIDMKIGNNIQQLAVAHVDPKKVKWAKELNKKNPVDPQAPTGVPNVLRTNKSEFYQDIPDELLVKAAKSKEELALLRKIGFSSVMIVPFLIHGKATGAITFVSAESGRHYTTSDLAMAEEVASRAALAIENAKLYQEAQDINKNLEAIVATRTESLRRTNIELARSNGELQDFAYVASHDLQEPLRKIQAFGNLLEEEYGGVLELAGRDYLDRMQNAAGRMRILIDDLLAFSRVTTKGESFVSVNLSTIAQEVLSDLESTVQQTKGKVNIGILPTIEADPHQMRQLLQNLIGNALKFHKENIPPIVSVSAEMEKGMDGKTNNCVLSVEDNGIGFNEKYLDRIFTVFQRLHGKGLYEGTGIGLAVCRKIVERHEGTITAKSMIAKGTTFIVQLPIHHKQKEVKRHGK
ncbi:MAG: ATP-binding protein [Candidatus Levyibacteriota bacterium]